MEQRLRRLNRPPSEPPTRTTPALRVVVCAGRKTSPWIPVAAERSSCSVTPVAEGVCLLRVVVATVVPSTVARGDGEAGRRRMEQRRRGRVSWDHQCEQAHRVDPRVAAAVEAADSDSVPLGVPADLFVIHIGNIDAPRPLPTGSPGSGPSISPPEAHQPRRPWVRRSSRRQRATLRPRTTTPTR